LRPDVDGAMIMKITRRTKSTSIKGVTFGSAFCPEFLLIPIAIDVSSADWTQIISELFL
jgi:hypothetical protein